MSTLSLEKPLPSAAIPANAPNVTLARPPARPGAPLAAKTKTILVGFDLGTNKSCLLAGAAGTTELTVSKVVPSVVGYVKDGIVEGIVTGNHTVLYGEDALRNALHTRLVPPLARGVIADPAAARDFLLYMRSLADPSGQAEIRAVVGVPANADEQARDDIRRAAYGIFDRILLIPEPFLSALGFRDDSRLGQSNYIDPVANSLFIDIGGGTSDLSLVQGCFPAREDQISIPFAGDAIDEHLQQALDRIYPNHGLSRLKIREIKETFGYVGPSRKPVEVRVVLGGKAHTLELGDVLAQAGNALIEAIYPAITTLIQRASSDSVVTLLQNIIVTGGGSQIRGMDTLLQQRLADDGFEAPKVRLAGQDFKRYVALGALKAARAARDNQWQVLLG